jgi:pimeloyl-ACP methyl ester carboxylesterase
MAVNRFELPFSQLAVDDLRSRLKRTRWCDDAPGDRWEYGFDRDFLADVCAYWSHEFDWKARVEWLSSFQHFRFQWEGGRIHFIHERGKGPAPMPLILTHGWPGSFVEMMRVIPLLTDPAAHGGDPADAFDVVVPSLPGYGFSDKPNSRGMNSFGIANLWVNLMQALGYERFAAQGGDIGAAVSTVLGLRHAAHIIGIHLNYIPGSYRPYVADQTELTQAEHSFLAELARWNDNHGAYAHLQGTRPETAAFALNDSPAGLAAWMLEKFREWSDCDGDLFRSFTRDELLTNVTLYWMTRTIDSSFRLYYENRRAPLHFEQNAFVQPPCAVARFPKEIFSPPREWVERGYNVQRWTDMPRGGHFAAAEEPELLAEDIRTFFRGLRQQPD